MNTNSIATANPYPLPAGRLLEKFGGLRMGTTLHRRRCNFNVSNRTPPCCNRLRSETYLCASGWNKPFSVNAKLLAARPMANIFSPPGECLEKEGPFSQARSDDGRHRLYGPALAERMLFANCAPLCLNSVHSANREDDPGRRYPENSQTGQIPESRACVSVNDAVMRRAEFLSNPPGKQRI